MPLGRAWLGLQGIQGWAAGSQETCQRRKPDGLAQSQAHSAFLAPGPAWALLSEKKEPPSCFQESWCPGRAWAGPQHEPHPCPASPASWGANPTLTARGSGAAWACLKQRGPRARSQQTRGPACPPGPRCPALPCPELSAHQGGAEAGDLCHAGGEGPSRGQVGGSGSPWASPRRWAKSRLGQNKLVFTAARKHEELAEHTDSPSRACGRAGRPPRRLLVTLPGHTRAGGAVFA